VLHFTYDGPGPGTGGTGVLEVDGGEVATRKMPHTIPFVWPFDESLDTGVNTRASGNENDYHVPVRLNGTIDKLTYNLGPDQLLRQDKAAMQQTQPVARD